MCAAYDARTGELTVDLPHHSRRRVSPGVETWEDDSWKKAGHTNVWSHDGRQTTSSAYVYLPVSTPTNDFYGGHRLGDNLYAESHRGCSERRDRRAGRGTSRPCTMASGTTTSRPTPNLIDITVDGRQIKAHRPGLEAGLHLRARSGVTGEPVWPIEERPGACESDVPGERASPTQPFPTKPPPFDRQGVSLDDLVDFTPEIAAAAREIVKDYRIGPLFTPPSLPAEGNRATLMLPSAGGGANWQGAAWDPETRILYVPSATNVGGGPMSQPDQARSDLRYVGSFSGGARGPEGLPLVKPPWGRVTAIDLDRGEHVWMTPNGHGPTDHPVFEGRDPGLLGNGIGAPLLTRTLLFVTQRRGRGEHNSPRINVFDKASGELLGHVPLPETANGNPVTYLHEGHQYIVVAVGGGPFFGGYSEDAKEIDEEFAERLKLFGRAPGTTPELLAFRLP